jgi:hypothetical protein
VDFVIGIFCLIVALILFWNAFTQKDFYAATIGRVPVERRFRYPTWLGRVVTVIVGLVALTVGIGFIVQSLK